MAELEQLIAAGRAGKIVVLTGAGVSAESGIPTFRGPEGYWQIGSRNYQPQELATWDAFQRMPAEVWAWYLYRRGVCRGAEPNAAHRSLVDLERVIGDRFLLITQNVDGLHPRAGQSAARTYAIHGDIDRMRCIVECGQPIAPIPEGIDLVWPKGRPLAKAEVELLVCARCGGPTRPHVLWFDEVYDEPRYRFESSIEAADEADLLWVIGTSGATNLPSQIVARVARRGAALIVLNADESPFSETAERSPRGVFIRGSACAEVPQLVLKLS